MRASFLFAVIAMLPATLAAQSFQADKQGFVFRQGKQIVRFDRGQWSAGIEGAGKVRWHEFLWHDKWIYETLPGGKIDAGPTLGDDGSIAMSGTFSAREDSRPVKYACRITPGPKGVRVHYTFEKTGPLELRRGICLHVFADEKTVPRNQPGVDAALLARHAGRPWQRQRGRARPRAGPRAACAWPCPDTAKSTAKARAASAIA